MAKTVTTFDEKSVELTKADGVEDKLLSPQVLGGRVRIAKFSGTLSLATTETFEALRLPDCEIIAGKFVHADLGAGVTVHIGIDNGTTADPDALASAVDVATAAGVVDLPEAVAGVPVATSGPASVYITANGGNVAGVVSGYVLYVANS